MHRSFVIGLMFPVWLCLGMVICAEAAPIGTNDAARAVRAWVRRGGALGARLGKDVSSVGVHSTTNGLSFYSVRTRGGGTVFTSSDDALDPILAFTSEGEAGAAANDPRSPLYALLNRDVIARSEQASVGSGRQVFSALSASARNSRWAALLDEAERQEAEPRSAMVVAAESLTAIGDLRVPPLVKTKWGQSTDGADERCFNYYTTNGYVCGCVATAMTQLMRTHEWPRGYCAPTTNFCYVNSSLSTNVTYGGVYDWANMPLEPNGADAASMNDIRREAIGRLCHDAGVSVNMDWGASGSGAFMDVVGESLRNFFGYGSAYSSRGRHNQVDEEGIARKVLTNLDAGYPVLFGICYDSYGWCFFGHAIVGDGYGYNDDCLYVHLNMGWDGLADLWYQLPDIGPARSAEFNCVDTIVYNIIPDGSDGKAVLAGQVRFPNGFLLPGAKVSIYAAGSDSPVTNVVANDYGVYGVVLPAGVAYEVRAEDGEFSGSVTMSSALTAPELSTYQFDGLMNAGGETTITTEKYVDSGADPGNAIVDVIVTGEPSELPLEWESTNVIGAAQYSAFKHSFAVTGGNAPFLWSVPKKSYALVECDSRTYGEMDFDIPFCNDDFKNDDDGVWVELGFDFPFGDQIVRTVLVTHQGLRIGSDEIVYFSYVEATGIRTCRTENSYTFDYAGQAYTLNADGTIRVSFAYYENDCTLHLAAFGKDFDFDVVREQPDVGMNDVLLVRQGPPIGLSLDRLTGTLSGTPLQFGDQEIDVAVIDSYGLTLTNTFTISVGEPDNARPVIKAVEGRPESGPAYVKFGDRQVFKVRVSDPEGDELCVRMYVNGELYSQTNVVFGSGGGCVPFEFMRELPKDVYAPRIVAFRVTVSDATSPEAVFTSWEGRMTRDWYAVPSSTEASDVQDGTAQHPKDNLWEFVLGAGDVVHLSAGVHGSGISVHRDIPVTFVADDFPALTQVYNVWALEEVWNEDTYGTEYVYVTDCLIRGITVTGNVVGGTLENCIVRDGYDRYPSSTVKNSRLFNCVITANEFEGGIDDSVLYNCTVAGNAGYGLNGNCTAYNTVLWENRGGDVLEGATLVSCLCGENPRLVDVAAGDCRLREDSPCLDRGDNTLIPVGMTNDVIGAERIQGGTVDLGAYEGVGVPGYLIKASAVGYGKFAQSAEGVEAGGEIVFTFSERPVDHIETNGVDVAVDGDSFVWRDIRADGTLVVHFARQDFYVDCENGDDANDGKTCATAVKTIAAAQVLAVDGETIRVLPGVYDSVYEYWTENDVKHLRLESTDGAAVTFIDGQRCDDRCVTDQSKSLTIVGFTLRNGCATTRSRPDGGGAYGGTFYDCVITNCIAKQRGGGTYWSTLYNCTVIGNRVGYLNSDGTRYGGGVCRGYAYGSTICNNWIWGKSGYLVDPQSTYGGGAAFATLENCRVFGNNVYSLLEYDGGGTYSCDLRNTFVWNNTEGDRSADSPVLSSNDDCKSRGDFYEIKPLLDDLGALAAAFPDVEGITDSIGNDQLLEFNSFILKAGVTSSADLNEAQKAHFFESFGFRNILESPVFFEAEPELTISDFMTDPDIQGYWTFTVSLEAGETDARMRSDAIADLIRVGTSVDAVDAYPEQLSYYTQPSSSLTYSVDPGTNTTFFLKIATPLR